MKPTDVKKYSSQRGIWWEEKTQKDIRERERSIQMQM